MTVRLHKALFNEFCYKRPVYENDETVMACGDVVQSATTTSTTSELVAASEPSFAVDQSTGRITTMTTLDREQTPLYHLVALAIDSRNTSMSATANVTIYVADKNDNKPLIAFPSASNYTVQVRANNICQYPLMS